MGYSAAKTLTRIAREAARKGDIDRLAKDFPRLSLDDIRRLRDGSAEFNEEMILVEPEGYQW